MESGSLAKFVDHKYINLETYRKNGHAVRTPVWFVVSDEQIFVLTTEKTGKVKRIRNNQSVKIAPCGMKGEIKGNWVDGTARFANESETETAKKLRLAKYGLRARMIGLFVNRAKPVAIAIQI